MTFSRSALIALVGAASLASAPAFAETVNFTGTMSGASEVPATASKGAGTVTATYDTASKKLAWKGTVTDLSGNATAAHFHGPAEMGKNAGVMVPVPGVTTGAFEGSATLTDDQAKTMMAGQTYFNVHTAANPGGEIRAQMTKAM